MAALSCAPSLFVTHNEQALSAADMAAEALLAHNRSADEAAIDAAGNQREAWEALGANRARYSAAWWALQAIYEANERPNANLLPPLCSALPVWREVGITIDVGDLCDRPVCWYSAPSDDERKDENHFPVRLSR